VPIQQIHQALPALQGRDLPVAMARLRLSCIQVAVVAGAMQQVPMQYRPRAATEEQVCCHLSTDLVCISVAVVAELAEQTSQTDLLQATVVLGEVAPVVLISTTVDPELLALVEALHSTVGATQI
jgi:hypothetical protein